MEREREINPGIMRAGSLREAGDERTGSETSAFTGTARNRKTFQSIRKILQDKSQRRGNRKRTGGGGRGQSGEKCTELQEVEC